jgi:2,7-dihydroxy-5-methyl-1-naphthoate 7-O-methyltransferase
VANSTPSLESLSDLCTPWCLHVAVTLRIAEHIEQGTEVVHDLAAAASCDAHVLHGILTHLVSKGVFEQPEPGRFTLNDTARRLLDPGTRLGLDLDGIGGRMAFAWSTLLQFARTGEPAYREIFGRPFWEDLDAHPEVAASFDALMGPAGHGAPDPLFPLAEGWERVRRIVDVGGGTGAMLAAVLQAHPHLRGTLVDLPRTVARSAEVFAGAGVSDRAAAIGQSFFEPLPAGADVYLLRKVINDWPDREAVSILRRCAEAARPSGRVVVLKSISAGAAREALPIEMLLCGGKPRTLEQFNELARTSSLTVVSAGGPAVECRPL